jgi:hypothetical protein
LCVHITEIPHYLQPIDELWDERLTQLYLGLLEMRSAILCCLPAILMWRSYPTRIISLTGSAWFMGQALDEWTMHNLWKDGTWEFPLLAFIIITVAIHLYFHDSTTKGTP